MWRDLEKFKTGKKIPGAIKIAGTNEMVGYNYDEYECPMGDILEQFIKHTMKSRWKKKFDHDLVTKKYKDILNEIVITVGL